MGAMWCKLQFKVAVMPYYVYKQTTSLYSLAVLEGYIKDISNDSLRCVFYVQIQWYFRDMLITHCQLYDFEATY